MGRPGQLLAIAIIALSVSGCSWECGTVAHTVANGTVRDASGVTLATAQVDLMEDVGPSAFRLSAGVMARAGTAGAPLKGHVTRARLVTATGDLIADIPTGTETLYLDAVVALSINLASRAEYDRVRAALHSAGARIILETNLAGRELIETTLTDAREMPSQVGQCRPA